MMYPVVLVLPSMIGLICGIILGSELWDFNKLMAISGGVFLTSIGVWFSNKWNDKFSKNPGDK